MSSTRIDHATRINAGWPGRPGRSKRKGRAPQQQGQKPSPASASQRRPPPGSQPTQTHWSPPSLCPPRRRLPPRPPLYYNPVGTTLTITASNPSLPCSNPTHRRLLPPGSRAHSSTRRRPAKAKAPHRRNCSCLSSSSRQRGAGRSDRTWDRFLPFSR
jgi:hypothetical protein